LLLIATLDTPHHQKVSELVRKMLLSSFANYNASVGNLDNKTVLITGGAKHLGRAIGLSMARAGAKIAFTYHSSEQEAARTVAEIKGLGPDATAFQCDVRDSQSIARTVAAVTQQWNKLDLLVNNAGFYEDVLFPDVTAEQWDNMFATNVRGPFLVSKHAVPALRAAKGKIINIGSLGGEKPWATHAHYCASKAALHMLTKVMAKSLAPDVAVNCVAPGMLSYGESDPSVNQRFADMTPMKRTGTAEDVVSTVMYLSTAPHFLTGQVLVVDGGLGLK
jgi:NAD(P)-dependent dehydrogenase (short-subunit alcohol dehydrogenase family)